MGERRPHWTETAERVYDSHLPLLGESDWGDWWLPHWWHYDRWTVRWSPYKPWHWPAWVASRLSRRLIMLDGAPDDCA